MVGRAVTLVVTFLSTLLFIGSLPGTAVAAEECELQPRARCFGVASVGASLSTTQAGAHPDLTLVADLKRDPLSKVSPGGEHESYATTRNVRFELPPGIVGDPNVLGGPQLCRVEELVTFLTGGGCPNGAQVGISKITITGDLSGTFTEPMYMMEPPGGDVVARLGVIAGIYPTFIDFRVRGESDYGLTAEVTEAQPAAKLVRIESTTWGVPSDPSHDTERCTPAEIISPGCLESLPRPPGSRELPFMTNPTRCGVPLQLSVSASSWAEPQRFDTKSAAFPEISGCNKLPFGPNLAIRPTSRQAASPTGVDVTIRLPASDGVNVFEPSQMKDIRVQLPEGFAINPASADGLATCSLEEVHFEKQMASACPDAAKLADTEFDIPVLEQKLKGAVYLREPEPGNPFRIWFTADDLGLHVKLPGQLDVNRETGQITTVTMDVPQAPIREARVLFKSGFRAPLITPQRCGEYRAAYEFVPWSGGPPVKGSTPMFIDAGCGTGAFEPKLSAGTADPTAGQHAPFLFTLTRSDGEQNPRLLDLTLPKGLVATFRGIPPCDGAAAAGGTCSAASLIGSVTTAVGTGPAPLWVPQPGKRPTAVYLGGPYKGAPLSIVAVVPRQAGPFDFGDEVVRSAIYVDPTTARATAKTDPLPQFIEGIPITYRAVHVELDRPNFTLNPTSCANKSTEALVTSSQGSVARPTSRFRAVDCAKLGFKPKLSVRLIGGTHRGAHPRLTARVRMPAGNTNIAATSVTLPRSEFIENSHFKTICTRVQFAAKICPAGSVYGFAEVQTPLLDDPLEGPVYLRSSSHQLPDLVMALRGPASLPIEIDLAGRIDSSNGGLRATFKSIPDAPVRAFTLRMQGGSKGLIVNSTNLCASINRATAKFTGQNAKVATLHPSLQVSCKRRAATKRH